MTHAQRQRALAAYLARPVDAAEREAARRLREKYARGANSNQSLKEKTK